MDIQQHGHEERVEPELEGFELEGTCPRVGLEAEGVDLFVSEWVEGYMATDDSEGQEGGMSATYNDEHLHEEVDSEEGPFGCC
jgi:hypothetical protein